MTRGGVADGTDMAGVDFAERRYGLPARRWPDAVNWKCHIATTRLEPTAWRFDAKVGLADVKVEKTRAEPCGAIRCPRECHQDVEGLAS
jgi:hypothetical protein